MEKNVVEIVLEMRKMYLNSPTYHRITLLVFHDYLSHIPSNYIISIS